MTDNKTLIEAIGCDTWGIKGEFGPVMVLKHQSCGLSIERLVISLYANGRSVFYIEEEMK